MPSQHQVHQPEDPFEDIPLADVSNITRKLLDIPYTKDPQGKKLDIYLPEADSGPFPIILYIHGGAFAIGDKRDINVYSYLEGIKHGYGVVSVNYSLSGEAKFPVALQEIKAAIRWLKANGQEYFLDGKRIAVWGASSGGNLAAMVSLTDSVEKFNDHSLGNPEYTCDVQAAVDWFGPTDFLKMDEQLVESGLGDPNHGQEDSPESRYLGAKLSEVPLLVELANPMTYIHKDMPPILIQHGRLDCWVPVQQSIIFAEKLERYVSDEHFELDILEGAGHGDPKFTTGENMVRVFSFLDRYLK
jgi:acetyl esterase/lipase